MELILSERAFRGRFFREPKKLLNFLSGLGKRSGYLFDEEKRKRPKDEKSTLLFRTEEGARAGARAEEIRSAQPPSTSPTLPPIDSGIRPPEPNRWRPKDPRSLINCEK